MKELEHCMICPRYCGVDRTRGEMGYCRADAGFHIGSICLHRGEEPVISGPKGICNVFFSHCNLQCTFCQNYQISRNKDRIPEHGMDPDRVLEEIVQVLGQGASSLGFVSPSHFIPHVRDIIRRLHQAGYHPVTVYNTNAYDTVESLQSLEGLIDVYLPDLKYSDPTLAYRFSGAGNYPEIAYRAVEEMYRQKGATLVVDNEGLAVNGLVIRHLVLPGHTDDSAETLRWIAENLSPSIYISLMSQYYPTACLTGPPELLRSLSPEEYQQVMQAMEDLGLYRGWVQELESNRSYRPDFTQGHPFERDSLY